LTSSTLHCCFSTTGETEVDQPTLVECVRFRGRERRINISQEIGTKYITFGTLLLEERTGERVNAIAHKHMSNSEQTSLEILEEWIAGRGKHPVTWSTLTEVLHDIELSTLATEIEVVKFLDGEKYRPTEAIEHSDQRGNGEMPTRGIEDFGDEMSEDATETNISFNVNPDLAHNFGGIIDTIMSKVLTCFGYSEEDRNDQANYAHGEIIEDECLD